MSNVALDQILQITTPAANARSTPSTDTSKGEGFRAHLDRAAEAADAKAKPIAQQEDASTVEQDEPVAIESDQQDNATPENEAAPETADGEQSTSDEAADDAPPTNSNANDEVTLSAAAVIVEPDVPAELLAKAQASQNAEQSSANNSGTGEEKTQQDQTQATTQPVSATAQESFTIDANLPVESSAAGTHTDKAHVIEVAETQLSSNAATSETSSQVVISAVSSATNATVQQTPTSKLTRGQTSEIDTAGELNLPQTDSEAATSSPNAASKRVIASPNPTEIATSAEAELATNLQASAENTAGPTTPAPNLSGGEQLVGVEKIANALSASSGEGSSRAGAEPPAAETPTVDRARFIQRVGGAIRSAQQRDGQIQLRLSPPELGTLKIQLTVTEGAVAANLETETVAARTVLLDNLPALRERLAEQGISIEKFNVDVGREGQQQADHSADGQRDSNRASQRAKSAAQTADSPELTAANTDDTSIDSTSDTSLDVQI